MISTLLVAGLLSACQTPRVEDIVWPRESESDGHKVVQRLFRIDELVGECESAGLRVEARRGISPIPMLMPLASGLAC